MARRRLLLLASLPDFAQAIRIDRKHREIIRRVALARHGRAFEVIAMPAVPREELDDLLETIRPTDLLITCHGRSDALLLEGRHGREVVLPFAELQALVDASAPWLLQELKAAFELILGRQLDAVRNGK